jgi:hypothetical protein
MVKSPDSLVSPWHYGNILKGTVMKRRIHTLVTIATLGTAAALLGGCAVYGPPPGYYGQGGYYQPQPVYAQPGPVYVGPPVSIGLGFGYWGGGRGWRHH